jgi:ribosome-associated protein
LENRIKNIIEILEDKKAFDIETIDLTDKNYIANIVIVATALNNKHSLSLVDYLKTNLKPLQEEFLRTEESGDWSIIDLGDIIIHIMVDSYRQKYQIEDFLKSVSVSH